MMAKHSFMTRFLSYVLIFTLTLHYAASSATAVATQEIGETRPQNAPQTQEQITTASSSPRTIKRSAERAAKTSVYAPYHPTPSKAAVAWADRQLRRMSLDEKIGQLISIGINATYLNRESDAYVELTRQVTQNHIGGIVLFRSPVYESVVLTNRMQSLARYPLLISADLETGTGMRFEDTTNLPWNMAIAATGNPDYARRQGALTARESRALGLGQILAPVVDVNNNANNPVINVRSYGEDPAQVARFAAAFIVGAQNAGVIATVKHFPGHGDTATDSHRGLPVINVDRARLENLELIPFRAAIAAGVGAVMSAHIGLPQIDAATIKPLHNDRAIRPVYVTAGEEVYNDNATMPATLSPVVINGLLRGELNFRGLVLTDALDMSGLTLYFTPGEAAVRAVGAGADMLIKSPDVDAVVAGLREAVQTNRLTEERIAASARRILAAKYDLGLVRQRLVALDRIDTQVSGPDAEQLAREIAEHAITLVRNDDNLLPLASLKQDARIINLALTNGDDRAWVSDSFEAAMARGRRKIETIVLDDRSSDEEVRATIARASKADLVITTLYGRIRSGQARSASVPAPGINVLNALLARGTKIVGVSFGNPYLLSNFPNLKTYLVAYGDMPSLQRAAARALLGEIPITGRLPITLPSPRYARGSGIQLNAKTNGL